jgi:uncharacterized protein YkwD
MTIPTLNGNYIDLIILLVLIYFASEAFRYGFWVILADFISFLGSFILSLRAYKYLAEWLRASFSLSPSLSNAVGFLLTAFIAEWLLSFILFRLISVLPARILKSKFNRVLGIIPALGEGFLVVTFLLILAIGLPINPQIKRAISDSRIGGYILKESSGAERSLNDVFGGVINDSLTYFTVEPKSHERVNLNVAASDLKVNPAEETEMFALVNKARQDNGAAPLTVSPAITKVGEAYATDLWTRRYFSHYSPEGQDVGDRLIAAGIPFTFAGENLALAPTVSTAFTGLMNSPGHRANILEPRFKKIGIGAVDNGYYGIMFVQEFTD